MTKTHTKRNKRREQVFIHIIPLSIKNMIFFFSTGIGNCSVITWNQVTRNQAIYVDGSAISSLIAHGHSV